MELDVTRQRHDGPEGCAARGDSACQRTLGDFARRDVLFNGSGDRRWHIAEGRHRANGVQTSKSGAEVPCVADLPGQDEGEDFGRIVLEGELVLFQRRGSDLVANNQNEQVAVGGVLQVLIRRSCSSGYGIELEEPRVREAETVDRSSYGGTDVLQPTDR